MSTLEGLMVETSISMSISAWNEVLRQAEKEFQYLSKSVLLKPINISDSDCPSNIAEGGS